MIRSARYTDFEAIKHIYDVAFDQEYRQRGVDIVKRIHRWQQMYPLIRLLALFPNPYQHTFTVYVLEEEGAIKGLIQISARNREQTVWHIENVAVLPEYRGQGIAKKLLQHVFDTYGRQGAMRFTLEVEVDNQPAIKLYESTGFRRYTTASYYKLASSKRSGQIGPAALPEGMRPHRNADAQGLLNLYTASTPVMVRTVDDRQVSDFQDHTIEQLSNYLKVQLKYCRSEHWVVERQGEIVASLEVVGQFRKLPHVIRLMVHPGFNELNQELLSFALTHLREFPARPTLVATLSHQDAKIEALKGLGFKLVTSDHLMARDNLQILKLTQEAPAKKLEDAPFKPVYPVKGF